jgi:flagellar hook assembly protein FlgD
LIRDLTHAGAPVSWDGRDSAGRTVPSGVYFVRAQTAAGAAARPVVIAR